MGSPLVFAIASRLSLHYYFILFSTIKIITRDDVSLNLEKFHILVVGDDLLNVIVK